MKRLIGTLAFVLAFGAGCVRLAASAEIQGAIIKPIAPPALMSSWREAQATYQCCVKCSNGSYCATCRSTETCVRFCTGGGVPQPSCHQR